MTQRAPLCLLSCDDAADLADGISASLGVPLTPSRDVWFAVGEGKHVIERNIRGTDAYVIQRCLADSGRTIYDNLMMALHACDAARIADADRVTLVVPYLPGTRQDKRKTGVREGVSTGLFARMIEAAGVDMVVTVEPHNTALIGAYQPRDCVLESVGITRPYSHYLRDQDFSAHVVASPDVGGLERARRIAQELHLDLAALSKERDYSKESVVMHTTVLGQVDGRDVLLVDDIIDTAGSVVSAVRALWSKGARNVVVACAHPLFSPPAWERLDGLHAEAAERGVRFDLVGTSSVRHAGAPSYYRSFDLSGLLAGVIRSVNTRGSVRAVERDDLTS